MKIISKFRDISKIQKFKQKLIEDANIFVHTFELEKAIRNYQIITWLENSKTQKEYYLNNILFLLICTDTESYPNKKYKRLLTRVTKNLLNINKINYIKKDENHFLNNEKPHVGFICHFFSSEISKNYLWNLFRELNSSDYRVYVYSDDYKVLNRKSYIDLDWEKFTKEKFFYDTSKKNSEEFSNLLKSHNLDIVFECNGHTHLSRFKELSQRLARKQLTLFNIRGPSGFEFIDYCPVMEDTDISKISDLFTEKFIHFNGFRPTLIKSYPDISNDRPPCFKNKYITFGYFGALHKITNKIFQSWIKILKKTSDSKIFLKSNVISNNKIRNAIKDKFLSEGIEANRLIFEEAEAWEKYLLKFKEVDISLSSYPHNFGTTFLDSLMMGVPIFDLYSNKRLSSQTSKTFMKKTKLTSLIVYSHEEYVNSYVQLSNNKEKLLEYKKKLRDKLNSTEWNYKESLINFKDCLKELCKK